MIVCKNSNNQAFPLYFDIYHKDIGYKSDNAESLKAINKVIEYNGNKGVWILDRCYDRSITIDKLLSQFDALSRI